MITEEEFESLPESIGKWKKIKGRRMFMRGDICAAISQDNIVFGGYKPAGFNLGKAKYNTPQDIIDILSKANEPKDIKSICRL